MKRQDSHEPYCLGSSGTRTRDRCISTTGSYPLSHVAGNRIRENPDNFGISTLTGLHYYCYYYYYYYYYYYRLVKYHFHPHQLGRDA